jgi:hypothetical protein
MLLPGSSTSAAMEHAAVMARYNRFLELLRDVKWNLLHRNCL